MEYRKIAANKVGEINGYTDFFGDVQVRKELAELLSNEKCQISHEEIVLTMGGSMALFYCIYVLCNKGDRILLARPFFPLMMAYAKFLDVEVVFYDLDEKDWQPKFD